MADMAQSLEAALLLVCEGDGVVSVSDRAAYAGLTVPIPGNDTAEWATAMADALGGEDDRVADRRSGTYAARATVACPSGTLDVWVRTLFAPFEPRAMCPPRLPSFPGEVDTSPTPLRQTTRPPRTFVLASGVQLVDFDEAALRIIDGF